MAATFPQKELYRVNIAALDQQHENLFAMIEELQDALADDRGDLVVDDLLRKLIDHAISHFATEEQLLEKHRFPGLAEHRAEHLELSQKIAALNLEHRAGMQGVPASLLLFLQSWLKVHILETDMQYSEFLNLRGVC